MEGSREEAWAVQGSRFEKERLGKTQDTQWKNARSPMEKTRSPMEKTRSPMEKTRSPMGKKTRSPSLAFAMEGLSEEGGDLLSRIAVQYHRRARA